MDELEQVIKDVVLDECKVRNLGNVAEPIAALHFLGINQALKFKNDIMRKYPVKKQVNNHWRLKMTEFKPPDDSI